ncbi:MAG: T9SS type A sorting domain-containing protein [Chitinophagales bacterium]|nr:T9SS type A sorting domain-containing protein [Chitinophagales bacterium]
MLKALTIILLAIIPFVAESQNPIRSIDGSNNNLSNTDWGSTGSHIERYTGNGYADSMAAPAGMTRPNPREISNTIFDQNEHMPNPYGLSDFVWNFGQFIDHDITQVGDNASEYMPIPVPAGDPSFDPTGTGTVTIPMFRSMSDTGTGKNAAEPRKQLNNITSWIDASAVYGSDQARAGWLRTFQDGKLKIASGDLLPYNTITGELNSPIDQSAPFMAMEGNDTIYFVAGDIRANEQPGLTALHTLFVREHNRLCDLIRSTHPNISDESIYQRARKLVSAQIQKITFEDWLPAMGVELDQYLGYDPGTNPNIMNVFSVSAYRLGHTMVGSRILRMDAQWDTTISGHLTLRNAFFEPGYISDDGIETFFRGMLIQHQQNIDIRMIDDLRNFMFGMPGAGGLDLAAINIMRGRERGLVDYNQVRMDMGMPPITSFSEISSDVDLQINLQNLYGTVDDIDPWVGMLAEEHKTDAIFGECIHVIIKHQFQNLRNGDRFYYENDPSINQTELNFIRTRSLSDIINDNTDIQLPEIDVFKVYAPATFIADIEEQEKVLIYPNPTVDKVSIASSIGDLLRILDQSGNLLIEVPIQTGQNLEIDVKDFSAGTYSVLISSQKQLIQSRFFVKLN